jgi:hypothetical protein
MTLDSRKEFDRAVNVVADVIRSWDPYGLISGGAPSDEFDREIRSVVSQIPRIASSNDAVHAVSRVFSSAFERERFGVNECREVGAQLYRALTDAGFIDT